MQPRPSLFWKIFTLLPLILVLTSQAYAQPASSLAIKGILQMTGGTHQSPVNLDGQWEFYQNQLLSPGDFQNISPTKYLEVPQNWALKGNSPENYGYGTYRLQILDLPLDHPVIKLDQITSAFIMYINGEKVASAGKLGTTPHDSAMGWQTKMLWLPHPLGDKTEIIVQVSNFQDIGGGMARSLSLGEAPEMVAANQWVLVTDAIFFGGLLLIGLYHMGLFIFRMRDHSPLWFGLLSLVLSLRIMVDNHFVGLQLYPNLDLLWFLRINYLTLAFAFILVLQFMSSLFPKTAWKPGLWALQGLGSLYALVIVFFPSQVFSDNLSRFHILILVGALQIFIILYQALKSQLPGARVFLLGFLIFFATTIHDVLKIYIILPTPNLVPLGLLAFLLFQSLVMARKFTAAFIAAENFSVYLKKMNLSLERFIPREVLSYLKKDSIMDINLGDHTEMVMTVLFADIRDFTGLSEKMTPKENFNFINSYLNRMGPIIRTHGGFVDKYMGDGIMALFPGEPSQGLAAAMDMRQALVVYNADRVKSGYSPIRIGVGLHTGMLMVGTIGEEGRMDSTVISDAVNLASRMEGLTKIYKEDILVSSALVEAMPESEKSRFRFLGDETVKGKTISVGVYGI